MKNPKISLILATVNRTDEVERLLKSLNEQTYRDFELIVIDQNKDDRLAGILNKYENKLEIKHIMSLPGLSRARNVGLNYITGDIIGFPDDDCWYEDTVLQKVSLWFAQNIQYDGLTGIVTDELGRPAVANFDLNNGIINKLNVWKKAVSITIFLRKFVVEKVGEFDETLGVGSGTKWGSGEETDYLLKVLANGFTIYFNSNLVVFHPQLITQYDEVVIKRAYSYGCGMGRVLKKHKYPLWFVSYVLLRPLGGTIISLIMGQKEKAICHWHVFMGRFYGWKQ